MVYVEGDGGQLHGVAGDHSVVNYEADCGLFPGISSPRARSSLFVRLSSCHHFVPLVACALRPSLLFPSASQHPHSFQENIQTNHLFNNGERTVVRRNHSGTGDASDEEKGMLKYSRPLSSLIICLTHSSRLFNSVVPHQLPPR